MNFLLKKLKMDAKQNLYNLKKIGLEKSNLNKSLLNVLNQLKDYE